MAQDSLSRTNNIYYLDIWGFRHPCHTIYVPCRERTATGQIHYCSSMGERSYTERIALSLFHNGIIMVLTRYSIAPVYK